MEAVGAIVNFCAGATIFQEINDDKVVELERGKGGHLWMSFFDDAKEVPGGKQAIFKSGGWDPPSGAQGGA